MFVMYLPDVQYAIIRMKLCGKLSDILLAILFHLFLAEGVKTVKIVGESKVVVNG